MCTGHYLLREDLRTIEASNDAEEEALPEEIEDDEQREIEIHGLISDEEEDTDFDEDNDVSTPSAELPLLRQQVESGRPMGLSQRQANLYNRIAQKSRRWG